jgi:phage gp36-like protein
VTYVALFSQEDLTARVSEAKLVEALDDDNDGQVHPAAFQRLQTDASSYVLETYYGTFDAVPDEDAIPPALKRLALDAAQAYLGQRHPEVFRIDWEKLFRWIDAQLKRLKEGATRIGQTPPDPAANHGGEIASNNPYDDCPPRFVFLKGMGIF